jgi:hypothetical protein
MPFVDSSEPFVNTQQTAGSGRTATVLSGPGPLSHPRVRTFSRRDSLDGRERSQAAVRALYRGGSWRGPRLFVAALPPASLWANGIDSPTAGTRPLRTRAISDEPAERSLGWLSTSRGRVAAPKENRVRHRQDDEQSCGFIRRARSQFEHPLGRGFAAGPGRTICLAGRAPHGWRNGQVGRSLYRCSPRASASPEADTGVDIRTRPLPDLGGGREVARVGRPVGQRGRLEQPRIEPTHDLPRRHRRQVRGPLMLSLRSQRLAEREQHKHAHQQRRRQPQQQQRRLARL